MCPAVVMSLMYVVSGEINDPIKIERTYTLNVMMGGLGVILGPIISGK
jgi:hypothetical protein